MKQLAIELLIPAAGKTVTADLAPKAASDPAGGDVFRSALAARLAPLVAAPAARPASAPQTPGAKALEAKIAKLIAAGASQAQIIRSLAAQLAESVGQKLNASGSDVREGLQAVFAKALAPPGADDGASASGAQRARTLAQRYVKIAETANAITEQNGQQKRFSGKLLDAHRAKDIPAQPTSDLLAGATPVVTSNFLAAATPIVNGDLVGATPVITSNLLVGATPVVTSNLLVGATPVVTSDLLVGATPVVNGTSADLAALAASVSAATQVQTVTPAVQLPEPGHTVKAVAPTASAALTVTAATAVRVAAHVARAEAAPATNSVPSMAGVPPVAAAASVLPNAPSSSGTGDERRVNLGSTVAIASGGDTSLGRTLIRAALAADARTVAAIPPPAASPAAAMPAARTTLPAAAAASGTPAPKASAAQAAPAKGDAAIAAFVAKFEAALQAGAHNTAGAENSPDPSASQSVPTSATAPSQVSANPATALTMPVAPFAPATTAPSAPSAATPALPPIDHSAIADQVLRGAFMRNVGESSEIRLTLVPESLGNVTVKLVVDSGSVTAHVLAQTPEVRDALVAAQPQLIKSLADAGLKLTSFSVDLSGNGFAGFAQQQNNGARDGRQGRGSAGFGEADEPADDGPLDAIPSFGPSTTVRPNAGDYNYLA